MLSRTEFTQIEESTQEKFTAEAWSYLTARFGAAPATVAEQNVDASQIGDQAGKNDNGTESGNNDDETEDKTEDKTEAGMC